jgi:hypothetical protein
MWSLPPNRYNKFFRIKRPIFRDAFRLCLDVTAGLPVDEKQVIAGTARQGVLADRHTEAGAEVEPGPVLHGPAGFR